MSQSMYFDLARYQKTYSVAYAKFREYIHYRVSSNIFDQWFEANVSVDLAMKNTLIPALEGYLINFFNKHDIKIGLSINKEGQYIPRVYSYSNGVYKTNMIARYDTRNEALLRAVDVAFTKLNVELIITSKAIDHDNGK